MINVGESCSVYDDDRSLQRSCKFILSFDRAGYGESEPHPKRTVKSEAFDVKELADKLEVLLNRKLNGWIYNRTGVTFDFFYYFFKHFSFLNTRFYL